MKCAKIELKKRGATPVNDIAVGECFTYTIGTGDNQRVVTYMKILNNCHVNVGKDECAAVDLELGCVIGFKEKQEVVPVVAKTYYTQAEVEL